MANPIKTWTATLYAGGFLSIGQSVTMTIHLTQGWEIQVPAGVVFGANVSLAPEITVYPSSDGGTTFDTEPFAGFLIATTASATKRAAIRLTTGQYAMRIVSSSPSTTVFVLTQEVITAIS